MNIYHLRFRIILAYHLHLCFVCHLQRHHAGTAQHGLVAIGDSRRRSSSHTVILILLFVFLLFFLFIHLCAILFINVICILVVLVVVCIYIFGVSSIVIFRIRRCCRRYLPARRAE